MNSSNPRIATELGDSIGGHARSVLFFAVVGVVIGALLFLRQAGSHTAFVDIAESNDVQRLVGLDLPAGVGVAFEPQAEAFYINHAYPSVDAEYGKVTASVAGSAIVVTLSAGGSDEAIKALGDFVVDYLARRNTPTIEAYVAAYQRAASLASFYEAELAIIEEQMALGPLNEAARNELAVQRSSIASNAATTRADAESYQKLASGPGPVIVIDGPRIRDVPISARMLTPLVALMMFMGLGVAQAWFRGEPTRESAP